MEDQRVILVNEKDEPVGVMEKSEAHEKGVLHRAFSIFIFNSNGEMLLQQRAISKYHSGGLWSNACCSHPMPGERTELAAVRRLTEELGFSTPLKEVFDFIYSTTFSNGLTENEFDHVFVGEYGGPVNINRAEVQEYLFKSMKEIRVELENAPTMYTAWFVIAFPRIDAWWRERYGKL